MMTKSPPHVNQAPSRRVTSYDVASLAGVSQSAVSRCFKPGASVSKSTYARVMQAAQQLDYTPNAAARSLITRRSRQVALIISNAATLHFPEVLSDMSRQFGLQGMRILLFALPSEGEMGAILADVWQHQIDGALVAARLAPAQMAEFEKRGIPVVLFNRHLDQPNVNAIVCDQGAAARLIVSRLAQAGHRRFALIEGPPDSVIAQERRRGACAQLSTLGLPAPLVVSGNYDYASGARGMRAIVRQLGSAPDAIVCGNDVMAIGCLDTARHEMGLDVPGRLSITGFDGVSQASWLSYQLTTLRQPMQAMVMAACRLLGALILDGSARPQQRVYADTVVEGATARLGPAD
ncbi:MAG: LacI family DNA-binding transcriptional regulator [Massilia sp.]